MDQETLKAATEYEIVTQVVYQELLRAEGDDKTKVRHDEDVLGKSGVKHQVDVLWQFKKAFIPHTVLVECKNYSRPITLEKIRNFFGVLHDVGNCQGVMVTKCGYQAGVLDFAKHYGIHLKLLRRPTEADWQGRVRDIQVNLLVKQLVSTSEQPLCVSFEFEAKDEAQKDRIEKMAGKPCLVDPSLSFLNSQGEATDEELSWWLPKNVPILDLQAGGPYQKRIELNDRYWLVETGQVEPELVKIKAVNVSFHVYVDDARDIQLHGEQIVQYLLKDFPSDQVEHIKRTS